MQHFSPITETSHPAYRLALSTVFVFAPECLTEAGNARVEKQVGNDF